MKYLRTPRIALLMLFVLGCGPRVPVGVQEPEVGPGGKKPVRIAGEPGRVTIQKPKDAPAHIFTPHSHPPRHQYAAPKQPDLRSLPRLKMRYDKCFVPKKRKRVSSQIATGKRSGYSVKTRKKSRGSLRRKKAEAPSFGLGEASPPAPASVAPGKKGAPKAESAPPQPVVSAPQPAADMAMAEEAEAPRKDRGAAQEKKLRIADDEDAVEIASHEIAPSEYEDWGAAIYLSNDDTMSLSSAQRVIYAIDHFLPLPASHIRPHELLNYFSFQTEAVGLGNDFSVLADLKEDTREQGIYSLGLSVNGRPVDRGSRRNAALTLVIDRSGSMQEEGRMDYLKRGLNRMIDELKTGDMVHMVVFDHEVCTPIENYVVGRDDPGKLARVIKALQPKGSTDLHLGLSKGYDIADRAYQKDYSNRVVMVTDALTNRGVTDSRMIAMISKYYDSRRIRLSGVGVGRSFNDALLDRLTEKGKGAYVFLGSEAEVDAVFGSHFVSLIETTANDVHFRLHLPPSLRMNVFYGEESSTTKQDVQEIHYFAGTSQLFLSDLMARGSVLRPEDWVMLSIEYSDPDSNEALVEEYAFNLGEIQGQVKNVQKARVIMAWVDMLALMAERPVPSRYSNAGPSGWEDPDGWQKCQDGREELGRLSKEVVDDPEIQRVMQLWQKYCSRYERPRHPVKREVVPQDKSWPGAKQTIPR